MPYHCSLIFPEDYSCADNDGTHVCVHVYAFTVQGDRHCTFLNICPMVVFWGIKNKERCVLNIFY